MTPVQAIRKKCLECSGHSKKEVRECPITDCGIYDFRQGKNPNRKKNVPSSPKKAISKKEIQLPSEDTLFE